MNEAMFPAFVIFTIGALIVGLVDIVWGWIKEFTEQRK